MSPSLEKDAREAFDILDVDRKNLLSFKDAHVALRALGWDSSKDEVKQVINELEKSEKDPLSRQRVIDGR
jgi:Ca2+-binding EF-hand superfamily protein